MRHAASARLKKRGGQSSGSPKSLELVPAVVMGLGLAGVAPDGRLPNADMGSPQKTADHLRDGVFYRMGFDDREIVALSGAHTVGGCQQFGAFYTPAASELDGNWTDEPHTFDASYYVDLLGRKWVAHAAADGREYRSAADVV